MWSEWVDVYVLCMYVCMRFDGIKHRARQN